VLRAVAALVGVVGTLLVPGDAAAAPSGPSGAARACCVSCHAADPEQPDQPRAGASGPPRALVEALVAIEEAPRRVLSGTLRICVPPREDRQTDQPWFVPPRTARLRSCQADGDSVSIRPPSRSAEVRAATAR
jgi:hypothetical protein